LEVNGTMKSSFGKKSLAFAIIVLFFGISIIPSMTAEISVLIETIYVDDDNQDGPWDGSMEHPYQHIQDAVDNAPVGSTVLVKNGIYYENIFINKTITLLGEDKNLTVIDGQDNGDVIYVGFPANGVCISGFTIRNAGKRYGNGMFDGGIDLHSDENVISNNILTKNHIAGIILFGSSKNSIKNNYIEDSNFSGIEFISGRFNHISNNTIENTLENGIRVSAMGNSTGNIFSHNTFKNNRKGISLYHSDNTIIHNNFLNNYVCHAVSPFNIWTFSPSRNFWDANYWDNWNGAHAKYIPGFLGFNFDWNPVETPYEIELLEMSRK